MLPVKPSHKYDDIIDLPHPTSTRHPRMAPLDRAAQFAPFAALTGYEDAVTEMARTTESRKELSEDERELLDQKIQLMKSLAGSEITFRFVYFVPDQKKAGGAYVPCCGRIRKIDTDHGMIFLDDGTQIEMGQISSIESDLFERFSL